MKRIIAIMFVFVSVLLTSCGHNIGTCIHGKVFNLGYDPEMNKFGIQYYDGTVVTGLQKEKSKANMVYTDTVKKDGIETTVTLKYGFENGDQITGYGVDAIKASNTVVVKEEEEN